MSMTENYVVLHVCQTTGKEKSKARKKYLFQYETPINAALTFDYSVALLVPLSY